MEYMRFPWGRNRKAALYQMHGPDQIVVGIVFVFRVGFGQVISYREIPVVVIPGNIPAAYSQSLW